jgi:hypothetical protein
MIRDVLDWGRQANMLPERNCEQLTEVEEELPDRL